MPLPDLRQFVGDPAPQGGLPDLNQFIAPPNPGGRAHDVDLRQFVSNTDGRGLADEFASGLSGGVDNLQMTLFGVAGLAGRELGIKTLEDFGLAGAERNLIEAQDSGRESKGFTDIETAGGFFKWAAASLGEAMPSLGLAMAGGGIAGSIVKKTVESSVRRTVTNRVIKDLTQKGFRLDEATEAAVSLMRTSSGEKWLAESIVKGGRTGAKAIARATNFARASGAAGASIPPQVGSIDLELQEAGIDSGMTALIGGIAGGALEALPAVKLLGKMFPGVRTQVAKTFVKDFAISVGGQTMIEGSTEAAQEMIQLAAMAYHDPTFDLFDPANGKRVIDAFAAGAIVGTVTGAGASLVGERNSRPDRPPPRKVVPTPEVEEFTLADETSALPEGFEPADNTLYEEVSRRVLGVVAPMIEPVVNGLNTAAKKAFSALDTDMSGGMNREATRLSQVIKRAHNEFLETHATELTQLKQYIKDKSAEVYKSAEKILDPARRAAYIEGQMETVRDSVESLANKLKERAARRDEQTSAEVDNMDFDDDILSQLGIEPEVEETERRVGPSGRKFDRSVGPSPEPNETFAPGNVIQTGETEASPVLIFGKFQKEPRTDVSGNETVVGYDDKKQAEKGRARLRRKFREEIPFKEGTTQDDSFNIIKNPNGSGWVIEVINQDVKDTQKFFNDLKHVERSGAEIKNNPRAVKLTGIDGKRFGFQDSKTTLSLDVQTMAYKGKNLDKNATTDMDGFLAFASEMLSRGMINNEQFSQLTEKATEVFTNNENTQSESFETRAERAAKEEATTREGAAPPVQHATRGVAVQNMVEFKEELAEAIPELVDEDGKLQPKNMFGVRENEDGTWSWGINPTKKGAAVFRALKQNKPKIANNILDLMHKRRRDEALDTAARNEGAFSGNITGDAGGDLGDTTGDTAGAPRIQSDAVLGDRGVNEDGTFKEGRAGVSQVAEVDVGEFDGSGQQPLFEQESGQFPSGETRTAQREARTFEDSDLQADDRQTDPNNEKLKSEVDDRTEELRRTSSRKNSQTAKTVKGTKMEQTEADNKRLRNRWGRPGSVKMMFGSETSAAVTQAITKLANFVTKTLGLGNRVVVMDDAGLKLMIDEGMVSDPIFKQTLEDPNVHARNIRIGRDSFVYLSTKILSDPTLAVLSFGHEMGHHVYRVAWDNLTPEAQQRLRKASKTNTESEFNEWMADQLAAWIAQPRLPSNPAEAFFAKVGGQIRRLYDFIKKNERFQLNETFKQFADAVALRGKTTADTGANPFNDAIMKSWFRNEGVTMYAHFGPTLESDNMDFAPVTQDGKDALARVLRNYPALVERGTAIRNWMTKAYAMYLAPSTSAVRDMIPRVPVAKQLVAMFNRGDHGSVRKGQNYSQAVNLMRGQFMKQYTQVVNRVEAQIKASRPGIKKSDLNNLVDARMREIGQSLQKKDGDLNATFTKEEQAIRDVFDAMHDYATNAGLPVRKVKNYFPRSFSRESLVANKQKILDHLTDGKNMPLAKARSLYNSLIDPNANDGRATFDATETPGFQAMNSRQVQDPFFDQFLDDNTQGIVGNYVNQVVKRAEFNRRLGENYEAGELDARKAIKEGLWDPKGKMHKLLREAKKQGATDADLVLMEKYIDANLGQLGRDDISPGMRKFMANMMAFQNMRVLLFTVFASLPDMVGPAIRNGSMKDTWKVLKNNIGEMAKQDSDLADMAHALGIIQDAASEHIMTEYVDNHHMSPGMRKANENFFKYTGLNWYTDFTRKYALAVGKDYIETSYRNATAPQPAPQPLHEITAGFGLSKEEQAAKQAKFERKKARGKDMLAELGLSVEKAGEWIAAGKPTYDSQSHAMDGAERKAAEALVQFVDESIMRPNASQRPIMASHPGAMLVYHLKGYMYAVHDIILKRIKFNIDEAQSPAEYTAAIAPAIAMMLITAVGLELRELIQYAGSGRKPPTDRMDGWDYTWELFERAGLPGITQLGFDFQGAGDRGMSQVAGIMGPSMSQAMEILSKPATQTIPKSIPIVSQIPALRELVRNTIN